MEIKTFSPVLIPTLNRYEHFKRCLDSLEKCIWADKTVVYVGLDYPPSDKYVEGWKKIDAYLAEKETRNGFKHLYVRRREHNCGISGKGNNFSLLLDEVRQISDRYILSEDDNEFSPNFLDYINKGLEKYKDSPQIYAICGYNYPIDLSNYDKEYYFSHEFAAWGYGCWFEKRKRVLDIIQSPKYIIDLYKSYPLSVYFKNNLKLMSLSTRIGDGFLGDVYLTSYLHSRNVYTVFPKVSLVRNWGHDGTGINCGAMEKRLEVLYTKQSIDKETEFDFSEDLTIGINKFVNRKVQAFMKPPFRMIIRRLLSFVLICLYAKILK